MASKGLRIPELELDKQESTMLAEAVQSVQDFYGFEASAEVMLWTNVIGICGAVYGPRIVVMLKKRSEKKTEKQDARKPVENNVVSMMPIEGVDIAHAAPQ